MGFCRTSANIIRRICALTTTTATGMEVRDESVLDLVCVDWDALLLVFARTALVRHLVQLTVTSELFPPLVLVSNTVRCAPQWQLSAVAAAVE